MNRKTIYIAEDYHEIREFYEEALSRNYNVRSFPHAEATLEAFDEKHPHLLLTDHDLGSGRLTGHQLIDHVREKGYTGHVLMISGTIPRDFPHKSLSKPVRLKDLRSTIEELLQSH